MPRDPRPYVTYPVGYTSHPRLELLSDAAFRVFHSMNDFSRQYGLDGRFSIAVARKKWPRKALDEIVRGIDHRPLVVVEGDEYVLRSYDEHQFTTADVQAMKERKARAGAAGGRAKAAARQTDSAALAGATAESWQNVAKSESKLNADTGLTTPEALEPDARDFTAGEIEGFRQALNGFGGESLDELALLTLVALLIEASPRPIGNYVGYIVRCTQRSPQKVRALAVEAERQAARVRQVVA